VKPEPPLEPSNPVMNVSAAIPPLRAAVEGAPAARPRRHPESADVAAAANERALVERARRRDEEAFRMLVDLHRDHAYGLALRITRSATDAEDVAQEAFVRAWRALPGFRGDSAFGTWLHRIVARRALDRAETLRTRGRREADLDAAGEPTAPGPGRDPLAARRLERLIGELSAPQRAVVTLFYGQDHAVEDIAATLGMNENTVKTHLSRSRAVLRAGWLRDSGEPS
jgi:RNA polymerase sigma-70 factor (ECF subfamily)